MHNFDNLRIVLDDPWTLFYKTFRIYPVYFTPLNLLVDETLLKEGGGVKLLDLYLILQVYLNNKPKL